MRAEEQRKKEKALKEEQKRTYGAILQLKQRQRAEVWLIFDINCAGRVHGVMNKVAEAYGARLWWPKFAEHKRTIIITRALGLLLKL